MKKIVLPVLLLALAGFSIFSFRKFSNKCMKVDFSTILDSEYIYVDNNVKTDITLTFSKDGRIFGFGGVNRYFAGYKIENNDQLILSPIGSTMMAGPIEKMNLEKNYFDLLKEVNSVKACKNKLTLTTNNNQVLEFVKSDERPTTPISVEDTIGSEIMGPEIESAEETNALMPMDDTPVEE